MIKWLRSSKLGRADPAINQLPYEYYQAVMIIFDDPHFGE